MADQSLQPEDHVATLASLVERSLSAQLHENAAFLAERLVSVAPTEVNRHLLALAYVRGGNAQQAVTALKTASSPQNRYLLAKCCVDVENYGEAEHALLKGGLNIADAAQLRRMLLENPSAIPNGAAGVYLLALCAHRTDRIDRAAELYRLAVDLDPSLFCAYEALCKLGKAPQPQLVYGYPDPSLLGETEGGKGKGKTKAGQHHQQPSHLQSRRKNQQHRNQRAPGGSSRQFGADWTSDAANVLDAAANRPSPMAPTTPAMKLLLASPAPGGVPTTGAAAAGMGMMMRRGAYPHSAAAGNAAATAGGMSGIAGISGIEESHHQGENEQEQEQEEDAAYLSTASIGSDTGLALFSNNNSSGENHNSGSGGGGGGSAVRRSGTGRKAAQRKIAGHGQHGLMNIDEAPTSEEEEEKEEEEEQGDDEEGEGAGGVHHQAQAQAADNSSSTSNSNILADLSMGMAAPATPPAATSEPSVAAQLAFYSDAAAHPGSSIMMIGLDSLSGIGMGMGSAVSAAGAVGMTGSAAGGSEEAGPSPIAQQLTFVSSAGGPAAKRAGNNASSVSAINASSSSSSSSVISGIVDVTAAATAAAGHPAASVDNVARRLNSGLLAFNSGGVGVGALGFGLASVPQPFRAGGAAPVSGIASIGPRRGPLLFDTPADGGDGNRLLLPSQGAVLSGVRDAPAAGAAGAVAVAPPPVPGHHAMHVHFQQHSLPLHHSMGMAAGRQAPVPNFQPGGAAFVAAASAAAPVHAVVVAAAIQDVALLKAAAASSPTLRLLGTLSAAVYGLWMRYDLQMVLKAVALLPKQTPAQAQAANAAIPNGESPQRESAFVQGILGRAYAEAGKYAQASECFEKIQSARPLYSSSGLVLPSGSCVGGGPSCLTDADVYSTVLWHLKQSHKLEALAASCFAMDRKNPVSLVVAANNASLKRDHAAALQYLARAVSVNPRYVYAHTLAGHEHLALGDMERAKTSFRAALRYDARHYNALYGFGAAFLREDKLPLAEQYFKAAISINRSSPVLHCYLGMTLNAQKRHADALQALNTASALSPGLPQASYQRAVVYLAMGNDAAAEKELLAVHELAPKEPTVLVQLGKVCKAQGKNQQALTYLHTALAHTRGDKDVAIVKHLIQGLGGGEGGDGDGVEDETVF